MPARDLPPPHGCQCGAHQITRACPVDCIRPLMSAAAFNLLARSWGAPFSPPATAGDVADLHHLDQLRHIRGLGPRRHSEISHGLQLAGLTGTAGPGTDPARRPEAAART
jgi:hypothetical protein